MNAGDNVDIKEDYGSRGSYFNISPTVIDEYTKKNVFNMKLENLRPQINIENNDKQYNERYQINMNDDREPDERYQISEKFEANMIEGKEVLKMQKLTSQKKGLS